MAAKELQLLRYLVRHHDRVNPREEMREVWVRFEPPCDSSRMVGNLGITSHLIVN
jgi:DNA-binding response OmpR family regulator